MIRQIAVILTLLLLQGCSAIKLGYQQLPTLSYLWLDSAVSFNDAQADRVKDSLTNVHHWHKSQELATYLDVLQRSSELSQGPVQASQVCSVWAEIQTKMDRSMRVAIAQAAPVVKMLGPRQLSHLARHQESKNEDWDKQWLQGSANERLERRLEKTLERYRSFYGDLSAAQIALVKTQVSQSAWSPEWGRHDRLRREQDLLSTLRQLTQSKAPLDQVEAALFGVWQRWFMPPDEAGRALVQKMTQQACDNLAQLHNTTSPEQRLRVARTLRAYERDIRDLLRP
ncbi:DUF6279 family lipoprotein [Limnohabitans parvus]|uniref:Lipoprotein n=1 Tax=Limnohabitans parvus II-B4 TaxID=1293052 RepID=A0A315EBG5_9BURK|nr:DUF6279 family lipoprotein [Limnohabitans parvus]PUE53965.1 hypothetical protein B9Z37_05125 [Limnohabitans parvus II-B4]